MKEMSQNNLNIIYVSFDFVQFGGLRRPLLLVVSVVCKYAFVYN